MGTRGTLASDRFSVHLKYYDRDALPRLVLDSEPTADRSYNEEKIPWIEDTYEIGDPYYKIGEAYYQHLYNTIRNGTQPHVTLESVRQQLCILKQCQESL